MLLPGAVLGGVTQEMAMESRPWRPQCLNNYFLFSSKIRKFIGASSYSQEQKEVFQSNYPTKKFYIRVERTWRFAAVNMAERREPEQEKSILKSVFPQN